MLKTQKSGIKSQINQTHFVLFPNNPPELDVEVFVFPNKPPPVLLPKPELELLLPNRPPPAFVFPVLLFPKRPPPVLFVVLFEFPNRLVEVLVFPNVLFWFELPKAEFEFELPKRLLL